MIHELEALVLANDTTCADGYWDSTDNYDDQLGLCSPTLDSSLYVGNDSSGNDSYAT